MRSRDRILLVFDESYANNSNTIYAAARLMMRQITDRARYQVFCRGRYHGPPLAMDGVNARVRDHAVWPHGGWREWANLARGVFSQGDRANVRHRWISNVEPADEPLLWWLFAADQMRAIVVFTANPEFGLTVARLAHIFSTAEVPHLIMVTAADAVAEETARDLRWLKVRLLEDGRVEAGTRPAVRLPGTYAERDLAPGVTAVPFDTVCPLSFLDPDVWPERSNGSDPVVYWAEWLGSRLALPTRVRDVVLFVRPDWARCGSATTFRNIANYFRERDGLLIDIALWPYHVDFDTGMEASNINQEAGDIRSALYFSLRSRLSLATLRRLLPDIPRYWPGNITHQVLFQYALVASPPIMRAAVKRARLSHIYLNHYFTYLFARPLIAGRRFFLDTHDIQATNDIHIGRRNAITRRSEPFPRLLRREMRIAGRAHRLCFVSQHEMALAARYIPAEKLDFVIALPTVTACPPRPMGTPPRLLIVASSNQPNEHALAWFLHQVWPRIVGSHLPTNFLEGAETGVRLDICGGIDAAFAHVTWPGVTFRGVVADLYPHYEQADIVLLPAVSGGGVAIKTIEAVLHGRPVVATEHALRGLPHDIVETIGYANRPDAFAEKTLALLRSPAERAEQTERSHRAARLLRAHGFDARLSAALEAVRMG